MKTGLIHKVPHIVQSLFPHILWRIPNDRNTVFLSFDDGPHPEVTPLILDILADFHVRATFFLLGEKTVRNEWILARIREEGHGVGNHGYRHLSGWRTSRIDYLKNADEGFEICQAAFSDLPLGGLG